MHSTIRKSFFPVLFVAVLGGCGGGGGGSDPTVAVPVSLTVVNASQAASESTSSADVSVTLGDTGMAIVGVQSIPDPHRVRVVDLAQNLFLWMRGQNLRSGETLPVGATSTLNMNCTVAGTFSGTLTDVNSDGVISTGDTFSFTASGCAFDSSTTINGTMTFSNIVIHGDPTAHGTAWDLAMMVNMAGFQVADATSSGTLNGDLSLTKSTVNGLVVTGSVSITSLRMLDGNATSSISNFSSSYSENTNTLAYSLTSAGTVSGSTLGGSVSFTTQTAFSGTDISLFEPEAGQMTVYGAGNSSVVLTAAGGGAVQLDIDANGDGVIDLGSRISTTWSGL